MDIKKYKGILLDLDGVLMNDRFELYQDVRQLLYWFKLKGKKLYLCSHNNGGHYLLKKKRIYKFFDAIAAIYLSSDKYPNLELLRALDRDMPKNEDLIFFDDQIAHVMDLDEIGIDGVLVDPKVGLNKNMFNAFREPEIDDFFANDNCCPCVRK